MFQDNYINQLMNMLQATAFTVKQGGKCENYTEMIEALVEQFEKVRDREGQVFFIGNGGSAAIASHMTADFMKNGGIRTCSLYDNAVLTCMGNDSTGHIMRCLAIADAIKERGGGVCFLIADDNAVPLLKKRGYEYVVLGRTGTIWNQNCRNWKY